MPHFQNASEVYMTLGTLMRDLAESRGIGARLRQTGTTVQFAMTAPDAVVTMRFDQAPRVDHGVTGLQPDLILAMSADTAHDLFMDRASLWGGIGKADIVAKGGSFPQLAPLWPTVAFAAPHRYAQVLTAVGRSDLVNTQIGD